MASALELAWYNGKITPLSHVHISPLDRGYLFGDGVYEVIPVYAGKALGQQQHVMRLRRSLSAIELKLALSDSDIHTALDALVVANGGGDMSLYVQVSRAGDDGRDHRFPGAGNTNVFAMSCALTPPSIDTYRAGLKAITMTDERWLRCDIKSTSLLANVLARQQADRNDAAEAVLLRDGHLIEGATSAIACVVDDALLIPPQSPMLLPSITRELAIECALNASIDVHESAVPEHTLRNCDELILMSSTREVAPLVMLDDQPVGNGEPGPVWERLFTAYQHLKTNGHCA
ncbi:MAG: aminotransferase class IV [Pseudomonadota bacterium]